MTKVTTSAGVDATSRYKKYAMADNDNDIITAPLSRIGLLPSRSTKYQGGMVDNKYIIPLNPVILFDKY